MIFAFDEKSSPLFGTLPGQILNDLKISFITNSFSLSGQIDEEGIEIDSIKNPDFMNIENSETSFKNFIQQVFKTRMAVGSERNHFFRFRSEVRRITDRNLKICFRSVEFKYMKRKSDGIPIA